MKILTSILLSLLCLSMSVQAALNPAFSYRGYLAFNNAPVNGNYDFEFSLWTAEAAGTGAQVGAPIPKTINVTDGAFSAPLDFTSTPFNGQALWLQVKAKASGMPSFSTLPRQAVMVSPYALYADKAGGFAGDATLTGIVQFNPPAGGAPFTVNINNSATVANLSADKLDGKDSSEFWMRTGNAGTTAGTHFLGTSDDQPLELKAYNQRAVRLEPGHVQSLGLSYYSPNFIGGSSANSVSGGAVGATIAGGGTPQYSLGFSSVAARPNSVTGDYGTVSGGRENAVKNPFGTIPGGASAMTRSYGQYAYGSGRFTSQGDAQASVYVLRGKTDISHPTIELFLDGSGERVKIPRGATWAVEVMIVGRATNGWSAGYRYQGVVDNNQGAANFVGSGSQTPSASQLAADPNATGWTVLLGAPDAYEALTVQVTGTAFTYPDHVNQVDAPIYWVASVRAVEVVAPDGTYSPSNPPVPN